MMKELNEAKEEYESIPIPRELSGRVLEGIRRGQSARRTRRLRQWTGGMAACFAAAALSVNLSLRRRPPPRISRFWGRCSRYSPCGISRIRMMTAL